MFPFVMMGGLGTNDSNTLIPDQIDTKPKETPIPKGCKRYYYNRQGLCHSSEKEVHFDALTPASANKKFNRWLSNLK